MKIKKKKKERGEDIGDIGIKKQNRHHCCR
jgi:hypothetical protein